MTSAQRTCLYALKFVLLSYKPVQASALTAPIEQMVTDARSSAQRFENGLQTPDELATEDRLVTCSCLKSIEYVLEVWPDRQDWDMREFEQGIGPFPQLNEIQVALDWVRGMVVEA